MHDNKDRPAASTRTVELVVAALVIAFGATVIWDSVRLGARWGSDGPQAGYFPFYIGLLICLSAGIIFFRGLADRMKAAKPFVSRGQLLLVMKMLVPSIIYVILIKLARNLRGVDALHCVLHALAREESLGEDRGRGARRQRRLLRAVRGVVQGCRYRRGRSRPLGLARA